MAEQHEVDADEVEILVAEPGRARLVLVDDGIGPFDLEVVTENLPVVRVVVDDQESQVTPLKKGTDPF